MAFIQHLLYILAHFVLVSNGEIPEDYDSPASSSDEEEEEDSHSALVHGYRVRTSDHTTFELTGFTALSYQRLLNKMKRKADKCGFGGVCAGCHGGNCDKCGVWDRMILRRGSRARDNSYELMSRHDSVNYVYSDWSDEDYCRAHAETVLFLEKGLQPGVRPRLRKFHFYELNGGGDLLRHPSRYFSLDVLYKLYCKSTASLSISCTFEGLFDTLFHFKRIPFVRSPFFTCRTAIGQSIRPVFSWLFCMLEGMDCKAIVKTAFVTVFRKQSFKSLKTLRMECSGLVSWTLLKHDIRRYHACTQLFPAVREQVLALGGYEKEPFPYLLFPEKGFLQQIYEFLSFFVLWRGLFDDDDSYRYLDFVEFLSDLRYCKRRPKGNFHEIVRGLMERHQRLGPPRPDDHITLTECERFPLGCLISAFSNFGPYVFTYSKQEARLACQEYLPFLSGQTYGVGSCPGPFRMGELTYNYYSMAFWQDAHYKECLCCTFLGPPVSEFNACNRLVHRNLKVPLLRIGLRKQRKPCKCFFPLHFQRMDSTNTDEVYGKEAIREIRRGKPCLCSHNASNEEMCLSSREQLMFS